jgi:hypothetical protein
VINNRELFSRCAVLPTAAELHGTTRVTLAPAIAQVSAQTRRSSPYAIAAPTSRSVHFRSETKCRRKLPKKPNHDAQEMAGGIQGCLGRKLLPLIAPATTFAGPPTAPLPDPGRIMPVPFTAGPFVVTIARAVVLEGWLPGCVEFALLAGTVPLSCLAVSPAETVPDPRSPDTCVLIAGRLDP